LFFPPPPSSPIVQEVVGERAENFSAYRTRVIGLLHYLTLRALDRQTNSQYTLQFTSIIALLTLSELTGYVPVDCNPKHLVIY
jgi:hypothetical protein